MKTSFAYAIAAFITILATTGCTTGSSYRWDTENQIGSREHHEKVLATIDRHNPSLSERR